MVQEILDRKKNHAKHVFVCLEALLSRLVWLFAANVNEQGSIIMPYACMWQISLE